MYDMFLFNSDKKINICRIMVVVMVFIFVLIVLFCGHFQDGASACSGASVSGMIYSNYHKASLDLAFLGVSIFSFVFLMRRSIAIKAQSKKLDSLNLFFIRISRILFKINNSMIIAFKKGILHSKLYNLSIIAVRY